MLDLNAKSTGNKLEHFQGAGKQVEFRPKAKHVFLL